MGVAPVVVAPELDDGGVGGDSSSEDDVEDDDADDDADDGRENK